MRQELANESEGHSEQRYGSKYLPNMKNYDSLTESRMLSPLLVVAAAVFEYYCIVELLLK